MTDTPQAATETSKYLHGSEPEEQRRLQLLNETINAASLRELNLRTDERRILEVGGGLGDYARAMAGIVGGKARVVSIEREAGQLEKAARLLEASDERDQVELRQGDAMLPFPLRADEWGAFDVAHARFLLEHVPQPETVVRQMVKAVRVGGRVVLEDDNHDTMRLYPEPAHFNALWAAYMRTYDRLGNDPLVGHSLVSLLHEAGAQPARNTWLFFGSCAGHEHFETLIENMIGLFDGARELMTSGGLVDMEIYGRGIEALRLWVRRPDAAMWFSISWAEGIKRG